MRHDVDDDDDDRILEDGEKISVRLMMRDNQPGFLSLSDAAVRDARRVAHDAREEMIRRAQEAWRTPPNASRDAAQPDSSPPEVTRRHLRGDDLDNAQARRDAAWNSYKDQLGNAWRTDSGRATAIERQAEMWRGGR
jgi:hypothetical protein